MSGEAEPKAKKRPKAKSKGPKAKRSKKPANAPKHAAIEFAAAKRDFLAEQKEQGKSHRDAVGLWNSSEKKRSFLSGLSVPELKKHRFLPKGATVNPWARAPKNSDGAQ